MSRKEKIEQVARELMAKQYELVGITYDDVIKMTKEEFDTHSITMQQSKEWGDWAIKHVKKRLGYPVKIARKEIAFLDLFMGLRVTLTDSEKILNNLKSESDEQQ